MQKQNIILGLKGPEVPEQLMNDLISLVQAKGYEIEFAGVHREHGKMECAIGTVDQLDGVPVPVIAAPSPSIDPKLVNQLLNLLDLQTFQLNILVKGDTETNEKLDELLKRTEQPAEAPKARRKTAAEKKEGGAVAGQGGQSGQQSEDLSLEGQQGEGGEGEGNLVVTGDAPAQGKSAVLATMEGQTQAEEEAPDSQTGDQPQQEQSEA